MISFFRYYFPKKNLQIGSIWVHEDDNYSKNPFESGPKVKYKLVDSKDGFVKLLVLDRKNKVQGEDSKTLRAFYAFYRQIEEKGE